MKIAIAVDTLIEHNYVIDHLEQILALLKDEDITIYTLVLVKGGVGGRTEMHKIVGSFLSAMVKTEEDFLKKLPLVPQAIKSLKIDPATEMCITLSRGFIHTIAPNFTNKRCDYLLSWNTFFHQGPFFTTLFHSYLNYARKKFVTDSIWVASQDIGNQLKIETPLLEPLFETKLFTFDKDTLLKKNILFFYEEAYARLLPMLVKACAEKSRRLILVTDKKIKFSVSAEIVFKPNAARINQLLIESSIAITFKQQDYPELAFAILATGTILLSSRCAFLDEYFKSENYFAIDDFKNLPTAIDHILKSEEQIDRSRLRRQSLRYNGRVFKRKIAKVLGLNITPC